MLLQATGPLSDEHPSDVPQPIIPNRAAGRRAATARIHALGPFLSVKPSRRATDRTVVMLVRDGAVTLTLGPEQCHNEVRPTMEPLVTPDDFNAAREQAQKDQQTFADEFRPSVRMVTARNMIQDAIGGSMGPAESVELTPINHTEDGVWWGINVTMEPNQRSISDRVSLIAGYARLKIHVLEDGEVPDDVDRDDVDRDDLPQLKFRLIR